MSVFFAVNLRSSFSDHHIKPVINRSDLILLRIEQFSLPGVHDIHYPLSIFQRRLAADVAAFPVPDTGFSVYLKAVMLRKLVLTPRTAFHQRIGSVSPQKFYRRHPVGGMDLFFTDARQLHNVSGEVAHMFDIFPRKILAPEVTARRRAAVNGVQQVELLDDARRGQVKRFAHRCSQTVILADAGAEGCLLYTSPQCSGIRKSGVRMLSVSGVFVKGILLSYRSKSCV